MKGTARAAQQAPEADPVEMKVLAKRLMTERGFDLYAYKPRLLNRRLLVRLRARGCRDLSQYLRVLDRDPPEWDAFLRALNIHVSGFFRNEETFLFLREKIFPDLIREKRESGQPLLLVSAGCAEGEEPYSLALLLKHYFKKGLEGLSLRIVGMDIEEAVLDKARRAVYDEDRLKELPEDLKETYFSAREGKFSLSRKVREMAEFAAHDIREGMPLAGLDLIMCRNVLIYFAREHQRRILKAFYEGLRPGGYLVLGKTESMLNELRSGYKVVDLSEHIYRKAGEEPCGWR